MSVIASRYFGELQYDPAAALSFPSGLPGFENRRQFLPLHLPDTEPLIFLQSLEDPALCFITLPILAVDPGYRLSMTEEDRELIGLPADTVPSPGVEVLCLAVVTVRENGPTANLLAPIVVNLRTGDAVQAIAPASNYSCQHPLLPMESAACS
jgi:flagellar assembly factor FliW